MKSSAMELIRSLLHCCALSSRRLLKAPGSLLGPPSQYKKRNTSDLWDLDYNDNIGLIFWLLNLSGAFHAKYGTGFFRRLMLNVVQKMKMQVLIVVQANRLAMLHQIAMQK